jgi:SAM-dependent methyltransferase
MEIIPADIRKKYNLIEDIWPLTDKWHQIAKRNITDFIVKYYPEITHAKPGGVLNAGSGGNSYGIDQDHLTHIDIAEERIQNLPNSIAADIHRIPFEDQSFDGIICVGSVINYCDPATIFREFKRVLKPKGHVILEFENSHTLELLFKQGFNQDSVLIKSFYNGLNESIYYFSETFIRKLCAIYGFEILALKRFHLLSPLVYRLLGDADFASRFSMLDRFCTRIPFLKGYSSNTIFFLQCC